MRYLCFQVPLDKSSKEINGLLRKLFLKVCVQQSVSYIIKIKLSLAQ